MDGEKKNPYRVLVDKTERENHQDDRNVGIRATINGIGIQWTGFILLLVGTSGAVFRTRYMVHSVLGPQDSLAHWASVVK
jgi:hypothetical protein